MISLLARYFIKDCDSTSDPKIREKYGVLCGGVGIFLNVLLFIGKMTAGLISGSIAITADAFNNLSDAGSSIITLLGFKLAGRKPDPEHPYGHGRAEYVSCLLVSIMIIIMAVELLRTSFQKVLHPEPIETSALVIMILIVSICVKLYMYYYNRKYGKKLDSDAMFATAADSISDTYATTLVLVSTLISRFFNLTVDGWCGLAVGLFILYTGVKTAWETVGTLMGQAPDPEFVREIEEIVTGYDGVIGVHDLMVHDYGPGRRIISLHAEVPASSDILASHDLIDNIELRLRDTLGCDAIIHMDPIVTDDENITRMRNEVKTLLKEFDPVISMHDFRAVDGPTHTNLIFDVVVPFGYRLTDAQLRETIADLVVRRMENCRTVIQVDKDYAGKSSIE